MASWRVGRFDRRAIHDGDSLVGVMIGGESAAHVLAARVVRAMNYHDELVAALREALPWATGAIDDEGDPRVQRWRALLARIDAEETGGG